jgi:hypothetical protein
MPQFNGKQERVPHAAVLNLRCPRNGKWTCRFDTAFITVTERFEHALGKTMKVASTSPDTGQQGGYASRRIFVTLKLWRGSRGE